MESGFVGTKYGGKIVLPKRGMSPITTLYLILTPECDTSMGADPANLVRCGSYNLRWHPETLWEHIKFLGYAGGVTGDEFSLQYIFRPSENAAEPVVRRFKSGGRFYSISNDQNKTGDPHILRNDSKTKTMTLEIKSFAIPKQA